MITFLLFNLLYLFALVLTSWLPDATLLPFGIDPIVVSAFGGFRALMAVFPPLEVVLTAFLLYAGFRLSLMVFKIILGSRAPDLHA